ncbi:MAG: hypothetical protein IJ089_03260 [Clostridia bacterium]|nr:hypothetical protein [Clostridia bacterium]
MRSLWFRLMSCLIAMGVLAACLCSALAVVVLSAPKEDAGAGAADARAAIRARKLGHYGMVPVYGRDIADGEYEVSVASTSPFFKIVRATLTVDGDALRAVIEIGSDSYSKVYMGNMTEAEADEAGWIEGEPFEGGTRFEIPVPALNAPFDCAAWSVARQRWYDRQLLIDASDLPAEALAFALPDYALMEKALLAYDAGDSEAGEGASARPAAAPVPVAVSQPDGEYSVEVNLAGGSGRANVSSPTLLIVREGKAWARLLWSSPYYDHMVVGDTIYENLTTDGGNSTFEIPITAMDAPMAVIADTTAMGDPLEIEYTLTFYSESLGDKSQIPQEAAKKVFYISLAIIVVGAGLNHFVKKKRK